MFLTHPHRPIMAAKHTSFWAKIAVAEPMISYKTDKYGQPPPQKALPLIWNIYEGI